MGLCRIMAPQEEEIAAGELGYRAIHSKEEAQIVKHNKCKEAGY
jgi:hypothetical protein